MKNDHRQPDLKQSNENTLLVVLIVISLLALAILASVTDVLGKFTQGFSALLAPIPLLFILLAAWNVALIAYALWKNPRALKGRSAAYGINSTVTVVLVLGLLGVANFLAIKHPFKKDFTKSGAHTLSDQTQKVVRALKQPLKGALYASPGDPAREKVRPLLDNLKDLSSQVEIEYVDPMKDVVRTRAAGIKRAGTLVLTYGTRTSSVEDVNEEKVTNALIKLTRETSSTVCAIQGHGERSLSGADADGFESAKKALAAQSYETKELSLLQEGKIPATCSAILILGPNRGILPKEMELISAFVADGGRAVITLDMDPNGNEAAPELVKWLAQWHVQPTRTMIIDPVAAQFGGGGSLPIVSAFAKDNPITRDFPGNEQAVFPMARAIEILPNAPATLAVQWLGQTLPTSWAEANFKDLAAGKASLNEGDKKGPLSVAVAVDGKLAGSKAAKNTRIVVFGSTQFANNQFGRIGVNLDFFLNAVSWTLDDESVISIRGKEEEGAKLDLSVQSFRLIFWLIVVALPVLIALGGIVNWVIRRRQ